MYRKRINCNLLTNLGQNFGTSSENIQLNTDFFQKIKKGRVIYLSRDLGQNYDYNKHLMKPEINNLLCNLFKKLKTALH